MLYLESKKYLYLPRYGGESQVVLAKVDTNCGGKAPEVPAPLIIFIFSKVGAVRHLSHSF